MAPQRVRLRTPVSVSPCRDCPVCTCACMHAHVWKPLFPGGGRSCQVRVLFLWPEQLRAASSQHWEQLGDGSTLVCKGDVGGTSTVPAGSLSTGVAGIEDKLVVPFWVMTRQGNERAHTGDPQRLRALWEDGMGHEPALEKVEYAGICLEFEKQPLKRQLRSVFQLQLLKRL